MPTMKKSKEQLPDAFEKLAEPVQPEDPAVFENLASNAKAVPNVGYAKAAADATSRGRQMIQQAQEARKGMEVFPPARLLSKHKP
jgi:hypothetical protein